MTPETDTTGAEPGTGAPASGAPDDPLVTKADAVLAEIANAEAEERRGPGRPRGAKDSKKRTRRPSGRGERAAASPEPPAPPAEPTETEISGLAAFLAMGWRMVGARLRRRPLTDSESRQLAAAAHPVLAKYGGGALEQYGAEIMLAITVLGLWDVTALPPEPVVTGEGEVFELGGTAAS